MWISQQKWEELNANARLRHKQILSRLRGLARSQAVLLAAINDFGDRLDGTPIEVLCTGKHEHEEKEKNAVVNTNRKSSKSRPRS